MRAAGLVGVTASGSASTALAELSGVAKGTLSGLERGQGNPTIETLFALAYALDATPADLVEEEPPSAVEVVRVADRPPIPGNPLDARLPQRSCHLGMTVEIYELLLHPGADHLAKAHRPGTREHMYVISGRADTGPREAAVGLGPGDHAGFPADTPHVYRSRAASPALLIMTVPKSVPSR
ncbi:helix-turn-helix domain-containing protein [Streptomyces sp. NPDC004726]